jgi:hypothetical protein
MMGVLSLIAGVICIVITLCIYIPEEALRPCIKNREIPLPSLGVS